ncbi:MAG: NUDIX hydrolase [Paracoccaceae bacterium]|nr:NUDIX hydrolase [Paracoccaceae bacterium]
MNDPRETFDGAKLMLFLGDDLVILRRDDDPDIPWPGMLDLPGGGREGRETPEDCVLRETMEEIGLAIPREALQLAHLREEFDGSRFFFAAHLDADWVERIAFGNEGAGWMLMDPDSYTEHPEGIPHFREILRNYMAVLRRAASA